MNKRINTIANLLEGKSAIDIGSDHGYLLIELEKKGFNKLLAIEKNKGPYENCLTTLKKENLENKIEVILSDGLKNVDEKKVFGYENIVIAGMGGELIRFIMDQDLDKFKNSNLILQANNNEFKLRKFLLENKFEIKEEILVEDNSKIYEVIKAKYNGNFISDYTKKDMIFGRKSAEYKDLMIKKWNDEYNYLDGLNNELINKNIDNQHILNKLKEIDEWRKG